MTKLTVHYSVAGCSYTQGALTHGDRRATETRDLSRFNIDNRVCVPVFE